MVKRSWPPVYNVVVAGGGFAVDQYNFFVIALVVAMMGCVNFPSDREDPLKGGDDRCYSDKIAGRNGKDFWGHTWLKEAALIGAILGQLSFGAIGDFVGRRRAFFCTLLLVTIGSLASGLTPTKDMIGQTGLYLWVIAWQFVAGIGVGGEYPLSATATRELNKDFTAVSLTFTMQGVGILLAPAFLLLLFSILGDTINKLNIIWRIALGFSFLPGLLLLYPRWKMHESKEFTKNRSKVSWSNFADRTVLTRLAGCAGSWFLLDVLFYGNTLMQAPVFAAVFNNENADEGINPHDDKKDLRDVAIQALITAGFNWAGYFLGVFFLPYLGLWKMQVMGFVVQSVLFFAIGILYWHLQTLPAVFTALFGLTFLFSNLGANMTTFIVPTTAFEAQVRARGHGISAAAGKLGGVVGAIVLNKIFHWNKDRSAEPIVFYVASGVAILGVLCTVFLVPVNVEDCTAEQEMSVRMVDEEIEFEEGSPEEQECDPEGDQQQEQPHDRKEEEGEKEEKQEEPQQSQNEGDGKQDSSGVGGESGEV
eukprot:TRINITY_DN68099_c2_g7_i2.p1 TRINITY_DN68099_c2_g7~~TRINITY_DN68099_c2_g7_i2.p1  ORF type:complete len:535 (-),score=70.53 TRINITY_DN68099_c2_g7_i2:161-1765(-)